MEKPDISNIQRAMMVSAVMNLMTTWKLFKISCKLHIQLDN